MGKNCGQTTIPTTDETPLPCEEFISDRCIVHEPAVSYLGLGEDSPYDEFMNAYLLSLIDARNRVLILENRPPKNIKVDVTTGYTLVEADAENRVSLSNAAPVGLTVPDDATLDFVVGTEITIINIGVGTVTIGGGGVTFIQDIGLTIPTGAARTLIKLAADTWLVKY